MVRSVRPDYVIRLNISPETSMRRKPEQKDVAVFAEKLRRLREITFQNACIIDVDAEQDYAAELLAVKQLIWDRL